jgi:hypothetical protein
VAINPPEIGNKNDYTGEVQQQFTGSGEPAQNLLFAISSTAENFQLSKETMN